MLCLMQNHGKKLFSAGGVGPGAGEQVRASEASSVGGWGKPNTRHGSNKEVFLGEVVQGLIIYCNQRGVVECPGRRCSRNFMPCKDRARLVAFKASVLTLCYLPSHYMLLFFFPPINGTGF